MVRVSEKQKVQATFDNCGDSVKYYFGYIPEIIDKLGIAAIALAYCFQQIESGHRRALYAGLVRKYRFNTEATWAAIDRHDMYLNDFIKLYKIASSKPLKSSNFDLLNRAQIMRNKVTHGQDYTDKEIWQAVADCLKYADQFNIENHKKSGFHVFGSLKGVTSSNSAKISWVSKEITELALKGLGI
jgi:hypothetical protein